MAESGLAFAGRPLGTHSVPATTLDLPCAGVVAAAAAAVALAAAALAAIAAASAFVAGAALSAVALSAALADVASTDTLTAAAAAVAVGAARPLQLEVSRWVLQSSTALSRNSLDCSPLPLAPPLHYVLVVARSPSKIPTAFASPSGHLVRF